ncbi:Transcriptional regulatory protein moc3 [Lachnellula suecica]|uniref:Transcriptional regulatory protein moc3 n=1 Tax=Lachnellula suecica TaxID=602035 RepID=A0A8T9CAT3_9HELO|nr:Transcriptional regulatory protein moc3 [Lachnellula suecica]
MTRQPKQYSSSSSKENPTELFRRPSPDDDGRAPKKARASRPKVKSGCITCKTRRVKCDETKPQCIRCQKFGRECDGYAPEPQQSRGLLQIQPRMPSVSSYSPTVSIHETEEESRYFHVFSGRMAYELSGFFDGTVSSTFWTQLILQESHNVTAIRHAIIALGALNMSMENALRTHLKVNIIQDMDQKHHEQAVVQHLKAIQALNQYISTSNSPQLRNALITCLLFVCFEVLQGSYASSIQQTYGGLKILQGYYIGKSGSRPTAHRRPFAIQTKNTPMWDTMSSTFGTHTVGSEDALVTRDRIIASHVEEYLESESRVRPGIQVKPPSPEERASSEPAAMNPTSEAGLLGAIDFGSTFYDRPQLQRAMSMYVPEDHLDVPPSYLPNINLQPLFQPDLAGLYIQQTSSSVTSSATSSPHSNTSPTSGHLAAFPQERSSNRKRSTSTRSPAPSPPLLQSDVNIEDILIQTFVRLDGQALFTGEIPTIPPLDWDVNKVHHLPIPVFFPNFHSAHRCWDALMDHTLQFYRRVLFNRNHCPDSNDSPASIARQLTQWQKQLTSFETTFQPILEVAIKLDGTVNNAPALVISLYYKITFIFLASLSRESEMVYDSFLPDFQYIVRTCALLISSQEETQLPRNPRFSFECGVVPPLHVVATKCRDPVTRREAVDLLFSNPRQEGLWDSILTARHGLWVISTEEDGLLPPPLPVRSSIMPGLWAQDAMKEQFHPTANYATENAGVFDYFEGGEAFPGEGLGESANEFASSIGDNSVNRTGMTPNMEHQIQRTDKGKGKEAAPGWFVPEENRVQLRLFDYHMPDRYAKARVRKGLARKDGAKEERETIIAW